jgi:signal transduction histidine kinase
MTKRRFRVLVGGKTVGGKTGTAPLETRAGASNSTCVLEFPRPLAVVEVDNHSDGQGAIEEAVERIAEEFRQAGEKAEQDNLTRTVFLAAVCRDLSQAVQSLVLSSAALALHVDGAKGCEALTVLDCRLDALRDLLGMWRLAVGAVEPKAVTVPVRSLLDRISIPHAAVAAAKGMHFEISPTCDVMVRSDPDLLGRMVGSLIENAVRFTAVGRVWVDCAIKEGGNTGGRLSIPAASRSADTSCPNATADPYCRSPWPTGTLRGRRREPLWPPLMPHG